jgi:transcriptional regulator with XRE-family HTH domain
MTIEKMTNQVFDKSGLINAAIAKRIGVKPQSIQNYRSGRDKFKFSRLMEVADLLDVKIEISITKVELFL